MKAPLMGAIPNPTRRGPCLRDSASNGHDPRHTLPPMAGLEPARILNGESVAQNPEGGLLSLVTEAMGVSARSGEVFAGTVGSPRRSKYPAVGDTVNAASRLEELNRDLGTSIVMSGETIALLGNRVRCAGEDGSGSGKEPFNAAVRTASPARFSIEGPQ
jgi:hypothetical protein